MIDSDEKVIQFYLNRTAFTVTATINPAVFAGIKFQRDVKISELDFTLFHTNSTNSEVAYQDQGFIGDIRIGSGQSGAGIVSIDNSLDINLSSITNFEFISNFPGRPGVRKWPLGDVVINSDQGISLGAYWYGMYLIDNFGWTSGVDSIVTQVQVHMKYYFWK